MPRPVWSGTISFGLVAIPIKMFHAVSKKSVSFNQLDERTLSRIRLKKVSAETGEDVPDEHIVKGYEISKGRTSSSTRTSSSRSSLCHEEHRPRRVRRSRRDRPSASTRHILAPDKTPSHALLAQAMEAGRYDRTLRDAQQAVRRRRACHGGTLLLSTMVFADEVVSRTRSRVGGARLHRCQRQRVKMAESLVDRWPPTDPSKYRDASRCWISSNARPPASSKHRHRLLLRHRSSTCGASRRVKAAKAA